MRSEPLGRVASIELKLRGASVAEGLVQGWTDVAVPRMARSDTLAESPEVCHTRLVIKLDSDGAVVSGATSGPPLIPSPIDPSQAGANLRSEPLGRVASIELKLRGASVAVVYLQKTQRFATLAS